ncbi:sphingomyelin synthase-related protein 1-like isoform X2 [Daktulosphaira vitifoliae]|nr:sphingomyelin synthase-related protein 1-like isoform X2 [Daktulosphaira vitifoliae]XP_050541010.1 sphingomyelin synthase-related protein 1-like isoform X2 [Daktulosphaira vitifoliae]XP_050541011.1 sphingomyelin synthase-related protein 1-like isoform X2 [Daktulosphaira vitifoliae]
MDSVINWTSQAVSHWLHKKGHGKYSHLLTEEHCIDGRALLLINETDLKSPPLSIKVLGDIKRLMLDIRQLKVENRQSLIQLGYDPISLLSKPICSTNVYGTHFRPDGFNLYDDIHMNHGSDVTATSSHSSEFEEDRRLKPEVWKALIAMTYLFTVTWITAFVMVIVHDRVPDMKKYPPLPDIFLDNVPYISWAFHMCELTGTVLCFIWLTVLLFHKHRFILLRRFFALSGTVFLLRCITMIITSLSVPGTHLECTPRTKPAYLEEGNFFGEMIYKMQQAYVIWRGAGMSIQGVRTCGDYMFSGHTVALTMLNFFITEYTPRDIYLLHTFSWLLNMFGIFFILSGHEHYSIDVFIAFYITSRLFLYYHTLANNQLLNNNVDSCRTRIWFPLFSFFESSCNCMVPNEYESLSEIAENLACLVYNNYLIIKSTIKTQILLLRALPSNQFNKISSSALGITNVISKSNVSHVTDLKKE